MLPEDREALEAFLKSAQQVQESGSQGAGRELVPAQRNCNYS
jgi:hypothetical protein